MLDVRRLRLLRELSHRGTIAAVAQALSFTPSAVSQQLAALEREAGVALLIRTGRRVTLTPAATALVIHTEAVLERLERAGAELAAAREGVSGPLRIGTFPTAGRALVPAALARLTAAHPRLDPSVHEIDPADAAEALRGGDLDVALVLAYDFVPLPAETGVHTEHITDERMHLAAPCAWTAPAGDPIGRWSDVAWIVAPPTTHCGAMTVRACQLAGFTPQIRDVVDDFATALALVGVGRGVALVPDLGITTPHPDVTLTPLDMRRTTLLASRRGAESHPASAAFVTALRDASR